MAATLVVMVVTAAAGVVDADTFERPIHAGTAIQTGKTSDGKKVVSIRTATFDPAGHDGSAAVETILAASLAGLSVAVEPSMQ